MPELIEVQAEWVDSPFFVRRELWGDGDPTHNVELENYYSFAGVYVGDKQMAYALRQRGIIHFEKSTPEATTCTIGFNPLERRWYGWSHRGVTSFGVMQQIHCDDGSPHHTFMSFADAKEYAKDFAKSVS